MSQDNKTPPPPDQDCIDTLRHYLAEAEAGRIKAIQLAGMCTDGRCKIAHAGDWADTMVMVGAAALLMRRTSDLAMRCVTETSDRAEGITDQDASAPSGSRGC